MTGVPGASRVTVAVHPLAHADGLDLPSYATEGSAGVDLLAAVDEASPVLLGPGKRTLVPTGLIIALPPGYEAQVRPRSGLALKHGITVLNSPGTIDSDYRGEVQVIVGNLGDATFTITRGMRIAQMVVAPVTRLAWSVVEHAEELPDTERGGGGFGSTGS